MRLSNFKVLTIDRYGALIYWEAGICDAFQPLLMTDDRSDTKRARRSGSICHTRNPTGNRGTSNAL